MQIDIKAMTTQDNFTDLLVLGNGYSARLGAMALDPILPVRAIIAPSDRKDHRDEPESLVGQHAHSHIFLPRLERELQRIDRGILPAMAQMGYTFVPGSYRLGPDAPAGCRRMFATRWQFDGVIEAVFRNRVRVSDITASVSGFEIESDRISALLLTSEGRIDIPASTLVLDAMGTQSPIMKSLSGKVSGITNEPGNIVYITQFFQFSDAPPQNLPDPLIDCPHDFGSASVMLYPGANGWFSVSLAIGIAQKSLVRDLRDPSAFVEFCKQSPNIAAWIDAAGAHGPNRIFINPRNKWNVAVFEADAAPKNYLAVGDALTTMLPTLGANCSFAATHIRIIRDLLVSRPSDLQRAFADAVRKEQFEFFQKALITKGTSNSYIPFELSPQNRLTKRIKRRLRRLLGLDRARIIRQLSGSSSL